MRRQVEAKNSLENYAFTMRNTIRDEKARPGALARMRTVLLRCSSVNQEKQGVQLCSQWSLKGCCDKAHLLTLYCSKCDA